MTIPLDKAEIVALFVESTLYGGFCVTFVWCLFILFVGRRTKKVNIPMVLTAVSLFIFSTMHVAIDLSRMIFAFYTFRDSPGGPVAFFGRIGHITHVLKSAVYITQTCVSDSLVVYRCHAICRNKFITIFLALTIVGSAVAGYGSIYELVHIPPFSGSIFSTALAPWITAFNVITAGTNIIATCLISWFIWRVNSQVFEYTGASKISPIIIICVESGAIYAVSLLLLTAFYTSDNNAQFIILDAVSPIIGIVFCLIIIQVGLRGTSSSHHSSTWRWSPPGADSSRRPEVSSTRGPRIAMGPMAPMVVDVTSTVDHHVDLDAPATAFDVKYNKNSVKNFERDETSSI